MSNLLSIIKRTFDHPYAFLFVLLVALVNKFCISYSYYDLLGDKSLYAIMSLNLLEGHGLTETFYFLNNPEQPQYLTHLSSNSPGYTWLLTIMLGITGKNLLLGTILLDVAGWFLIFLSMTFILRACNAGRATINICVLLTGLFLFPFETQSPSKDNFATSSLLFATWYVIHLMKLQSVRWPQYFLLTILCLLPGLLKSSYIPIAPVFSFPFLIAAFITKEKKFFKLFVTSFTILFIIDGVYVAWAYSRVSEFSSSYFGFLDVNHGSKKPYFSNLKYTFPFLPTSFLNLELIGSQIESRFGIPFPNTAFVFQLINWLVLVSLIILLAAPVITRSRKFFNSETGPFYITSGFIALMLIGSVCAVSLLQPLRNYKGGGVWTYVMESRTFFYVMVIAQMILVLTALKNQSKLAAVFLVLFVLSCCHGLYFSLKSASHRKEILLAEEKTNYFRQVLSLVDSVQLKNPDKHVRLLTDIEHLKWLGLLQNKNVYSGIFQLKGDTKAPPDFVIITSLFKTDLTNLNPYLQREDVEILKDDPDRILLIQRNDD